MSKRVKFHRPGVPTDLPPGSRGQEVVGEAPPRPTLKEWDEQNDRHGYSQPTLHQYEQLKTELAQVKEDLADEQKIREMMYSILDRTCRALKGEPPPNVMWDLSDLPEVAADLRARALPRLGDTPGDPPISTPEPT